MTAYVMGTLPSTWETCNEFPVSGFSSFNCCVFWGNGPVDGKRYFSVCMCVSISHFLVYLPLCLCQSFKLIFQDLKYLQGSGAGF